MAEPNLVIVTCMKNEGPFILEWLAWQRLMGVDEIVVLTNDCDDGTDFLLDALDRKGMVQHLPNPVVLSKAPASGVQLIAFAYARQLPIWRRADYVFLTDVDEFVLLRNGDPSIKAFLKRFDYPDVISMSENNFGAGEIFEYQDEPITGQFTRCAGLTPRKTISRRGFKSIARNDTRLAIANHRPTAAPEHAASLSWIDGSGRDFPMELRSVHQKGVDARGHFDLIVLNHYSLRSFESFMVKQDRGDVLRPGNIDKRYFRRRNRLPSTETEMQQHQPRLEEEIANLKRDPELAELHDMTVEKHREKIARLRKSPAFDELLELFDLQNVHA